MINPFWNPTEHRLRALWRLILQASFLLASIGIPGVIFSLAFRFARGNQGQIDSFLISPIATLLGITFSMWLAGRLLDRRPFVDYGFHFNRWWWRDFIFGLVLGAGLMLLIFLVELSAGWVTISGTFFSGMEGISFIPGICISLVLFLCVGFSEEMWTRGYLLRNLAEGFNLKFIGPRSALLLAYLVSSSFFGLLHASNPNATALSTFLLGFAGLFLGLGFLLTGELAIPIGIHITWNFFEGNVFGFAVSGTTPPGVFMQINQTGPTLWTGGAFGPEAGLIGLAALILGSLAIYLWVKVNHKTAPLQTRLAQYLK
jgi:membrane protease YdiL (CAAX protease family)